MKLMALLNQQLILFQSIFRIQKILQILKFVDKNKKKSISIYGLYNQFNHARSKNQITLVYYSNKLLLKILQFFKHHGFIHNYFKINPTFIKPLLIFHSPIHFLNTLVFIYLNTYSLSPCPQKIFKIISQPNRQIYIRYSNLVVLTNTHTKTLKRTFYLLHTNRGVITHYEAVNLKMGGNLILFVN